MNLEDQLRGDQSGAGSARLTERIQVEEVEAVSLLEDGRRASGVSDPYGQLKTDVQRAVIPKLGPWLFSNQESPDLRREVTESVATALDASGTPLAAVDLLPVRRDFAFVVDKAVLAADVVKAAAGADKSLITSVLVFDVFEGEALAAEGKKSVAIEVTLQPTSETLTEKDIEAVSEKIVAGIKSATGGEIRG